MLKDVIDGFVNIIIADVPTFTADTCKGYDDKAVFDNILMTDFGINSPSGVIVSYGGISRPNQPSEFGGLLVGWIIIVTGFFLLAMEEDDQPQIEAGYKFVDDMLLAVLRDNTLGGACMGTQIIDAEPPMEYLRNGATKYLMMQLRFVATENLE